jgi:hypothetical protein
MRNATLITLAFCLLSAPALLAGKTPSKSKGSKTVTVTGTVVEVQGSTLVLETADGRVTIDAGHGATVSGVCESLGDIHPDDGATVVCRKDGDALSALSVAVEAPAAGDQGSGKSKGKTGKSDKTGKTEKADKTAKTDKAGKTGTSDSRSGRGGEEASAEESSASGSGKGKSKSSKATSAKEKSGGKGAKMEEGDEGEPDPAEPEPQKKKDSKAKNK